MRLENYYYYYGFFYLLFVLIRMLRRTGDFSFKLPTSLVEIQELQEKTKELNNTIENKIIIFFRCTNFVWICLGILKAEYSVMFYLILYVVILTVLVKSIPSKIDRRIGYFIVNLFIIILTSIILYHEIILNLIP